MLITVIKLCHLDCDSYKILFVIKIYYIYLTGDT